MKFAEAARQAGVPLSTAWRYAKLPQVKRYKRGKTWTRGTVKALERTRKEKLAAALAGRPPLTGGKGTW